MTHTGPTPAARQWRNVTLVRERDERGVRGLWIWLIALVIALAPTAVYLLQQMQYVQVRYRIEELRAEQTRLAEEELRLRVERATLESLRRVERRASTELGLVAPPPERVVVVRPQADRSGELLARGEVDAR